MSWKTGTTWMIAWGLLGSCTFRTVIEPAAAAEPSRLRVSDNGRYLADDTGEPFFWLGGTGWAFFSRPKRADVEFYLKNLAGKGFNVIQAVIGFYGHAM